MALAAYSVWKRLSPAQKRGLRKKLSGATRALGPARGFDKV
jgi:hypothetical protein